MAKKKSDSANESSSTTVKTALPELTTRERIKAYIKSGKSGIYLVTFEEIRAEQELRWVAQTLNFRLSAWTLTEGIHNLTDKSTIPDTQDPMAALDAFLKMPDKSILIARDFHMLMMDMQAPNPLLVRRVKDVLLAGKVSNKVLIISGCRLKLPEELTKEIVVIEFKLPDKEQLKVVLTGIAKSAKIELDADEDPTLDAACGLTTTEAEDAFALSVVESGKIVPAIVAREKAATVKKNGIVELIDPKIGIKDIGGLDLLKEWLQKRRLALTEKAREYGLPTPKGVLLIGVPGAGKSLTAKATANIFNVPLLKLDAGRVFGGLVGESEANMRTAIQTAEAVAPCVLWVEELDKSFTGVKSSNHSDGGTAARVISTFLQWLQEKTASVFVIATANDISQLPPELLRKGRWDDMFMVDLPNATERAAIWAVHLSKRGRNPDKFNLARLVERTEGFTGAEIEAILNDGMFSAFADDKEITDIHLEAAITHTVPLSRTMSDQIEKLRAWSNGRARLASSPDAAATPTHGTTRKMME